MPPQECTANCTRSKPDSLRAPTRSLPAQTTRDDDEVWELSLRTHRRTTSVAKAFFLPTALSQVHLRWQSEHGSTPVSLLPRHSGVSFRVSAPANRVISGKGGWGQIVPCGRQGRSRWLCPPRYGNCTSEANLRVLRFNFSERHKKRNSPVLLLTAILFLQNGLGGSPFIFLSSRSGSSDINPDCRRMQSLSGPKKTCCTAAGRAGEMSD